jgi:hypothetical protein
MELNKKEDFFNEDEFLNVYKKSKRSKKMNVDKFYRCVLAITIFLFCLAMIMVVFKATT